MELTATEWLTGILVLVTIFYAWTTHRTVKAMHEQAHAASRPYVVVAPHVIAGDPTVRLRIVNTGRSPATALRLRMDRAFYQFAEKTPEHDLASFAAFQNPIESLAPGADLIFYLAEGFKIFDASVGADVCPQVFSISATYSTGQKIVEENTVVDLRPYRGTALPGNPMNARLKDINESLQRIATQIERRSES